MNEALTVANGHKIAAPRLLRARGFLERACLLSSYTKNPQRGISLTKNILQIHTDQAKKSFHSLLATHSHKFESKESSTMDAATCNELILVMEGRHQRCNSHCSPPQVQL